MGVTSVRVLGIDACRGGWVGLAWAGGDRVWPYAAATFAATVAAAQLDGSLAAVGADIPIGLSDNGVRVADVQARALLGPRRSSVFETPVRSAVEAANQQSASSLNQAATGHKVSVQAFGLRHRILEVERWLAAVPSGERPPVYEVHPEVSFHRLAGETLAHAKRTWAGAEQRRALLASASLQLFGGLGAAGALAAVDDVVDAAVVAWSTARIVSGAAESLPHPPQPVGGGRTAAIWV